MNEQHDINYNRIAKAIGYIQENFTAQPTLEEIAENVHLSPFHFQRIFKDWAGVSPKKFLQYISVQHAKKILDNSITTLSETAYQTGLSGTGRLHDLFVKIEGMTPGEYKNKGEKLAINYSYSESLFGRILIASTHKGICYMGFSDEHESSLADLKKIFPKAKFTQQTDEIQQNALQIHNGNWNKASCVNQGGWNKVSCIKLHLKGTNFQLKVWEALLKIPMGNLATYGTIAKEIKNSNASRAVGTAIGNNPIAFLIPCHRVIRSTGVFGGYMWGETRKKAIIGWEAANTDKANIILE